MELALLIYLAGVVGKLNAFLLCIGMCLFFIGGIIITYYIDVYNTSKKYLIIPLIGVIILFVSIFIPSEKTIYLMAGDYVAQEVVTSATAKKDLEILNEKLDTELEGLKSKKK